MVTLNMICLSLAFISGFMPESWQCQMSMYSLVSMLFGSYTMTNVISALRFYMAKLASKTKIVKSREMIFLILFSTVICYGLVPSLVSLQHHLGFHNHITHCEKQAHHRPRSVVLPLVDVTFVISMTILGIVSDVKMFLFVKKRQNSVGVESKIIPWKSTNEDVKSDLQVPLRATVISTGLLLLVTLIISLSFTLLSIEGGQKFIEYFIGILSMTSSSLLPIIIVNYIVKQQKKIEATQPPQTLQFHEEDENSQQAELSKHGEFVELSISQLKVVKVTQPLQRLQFHEDTEQN